MSAERPRGRAPRGCRPLSSCSFDPSNASTPLSKASSTESPSAFAHSWSVLSISTPVSSTFSVPGVHFPLPLAMCMIPSRWSGGTFSRSLFSTLPRSSPGVVWPSRWLACASRSAVSLPILISMGAAVYHQSPWAGPSQPPSWSAASRPFPRRRPCSSARATTRRGPPPPPGSRGRGPQGGGRAGGLQPVRNRRHRHSASSRDAQDREGVGGGRCGSPGRGLRGRARPGHG